MEFNKQRMVEHFRWIELRSPFDRCRRSSSICISGFSIDMQIIPFIELKWSANSFVAHKTQSWQLHENCNGKQFDRKKQTRRIDDGEEVTPLCVITRWTRCATDPTSNALYDQCNRCVQSEKTIIWMHSFSVVIIYGNLEWIEFVFVRVGFSIFMFVLRINMLQVCGACSCSQWPLVAQVQLTCTFTLFGWSPTNCDGSCKLYWNEFNAVNAFWNSKAYVALSVPLCVMCCICNHIIFRWITIHLLQPGDAWICRAEMIPKNSQWICEWDFWTYINVCDTMGRRNDSRKTFFFVFE